MAKVAEIKEVEVAVLKPYENNAKIHGKDQVEKICNSIKEFGFLSPCLIDRDLNIIAGHGRVLAAQKLGLKTVPCLFIEGLTDEQRKAYILADNRLTELGEWNMDIVVSELKELDFSGFDVSVTGFDLDLDFDGENEQEIQEDEVPDLPEEPKSKRGDIYLLGDHRLMCGDSTSREDVEALMNGENATLMLTDPPYGINVVQNKQVGGVGALHFGGKIGKRVESSTYKPVENDETTDAARKNYEITKELSEEQIIFGGNYFTDFLTPSRCWIVWDKQNTGNFADAELAWTSFDKGVRLYRFLWNGLCREGSRKIEGKTRVHPTQKPVGMLANILKDFSAENDLILDCFGGSGSTLIACEHTGRKCYMMEIDPHYVDVIVQRWENLTGKKAVLLN